MGMKSSPEKFGAGFSLTKGNMKFQIEDFKLKIVTAALAVVAGVSPALAAPSTEAVISKSDGLHIGGAATDRIGFGAATPVARSANTMSAYDALVLRGIIAGSGTDPLLTSTSQTYTTPVIAGGLTASGSGSNDFSASTGTFKTSSGANTLSGAVSIADATTPSLTTASGKTNTGFVQVNGKTSGAFKITTADATAQTVTMSVAAQTSGAGTITIPDLAGATVTPSYIAKAETLTNKTLTSPTINTPIITRNAPNTQTGSTYTLLSTDDYLIINASGTCTLTLGTATAGKMFTVKTIAAQTVVSASSNVVPQATATAGTAILAGTAGKWATLVGDGTNWVIMASN
jgi:hypothetical protein